MEKYSNTPISDQRMKTCSHCGEIKPLDAFPLAYRYQSGDGHIGTCKACRNDQARARRKSRRQPDKVFYDTVTFGRFTYTGPLEIKDGKLRPYWSEDKKTRFCADFPTMLNQDLADKYELTISAVRGYARRWNLHKDPDWMRAQSRKHIKQAQLHNKIYGHSGADLVELGKPYRFKPGVGANLTPEQQQAKIKKTWETRHKNMRLKKRQEMIKQIRECNRQKRAEGNQEAV